MKFKIFLILISFHCTFLNAQWERIGFAGENILDIVLKEDLLIIPVRGPSYGQTTFYGSTNYGVSWDSRGFINEPWIVEFEMLRNFVFCSLNWVCAGFCSPAPCIFKSEDNCTTWDTSYVKKFGVSHLLAHNDYIFANAGDSFIYSIDYGNSWQKMLTLPSADGLMFSIDGLLYFVTYTSEIFRSEDNGLNWILLSSNLPGATFSLIKNNLYLFAGGIYGIACFLNDVDWELCNSGVPDNFRVEILAGEPHILFSSGTDTTFTHLVLCSTNNGKNWINISDGLTLDQFDGIYSLLIKGHYLFAATEDGIWRFNFSSLLNITDQSINPWEFYLAQNYPNPFNPRTKITWQSPVSSWQTLKVYDLLGNDVVTLVDEYKLAGSYEVEFQSSIGNRQLANGVYYYQLKAGDPSTGSGQSFIQTKKMILVK